MSEELSLLEEGHTCLWTRQPRGQGQRGQCNFSLIKLINHFAMVGGGAHTANYASVPTYASTLKYSPPSPARLYGWQYAESYTELTTVRVEGP